MKILGIKINIEKKDGFLFFSFNFKGKVFAKKISEKSDSTILEKMAKITILKLNGK